MRNFKKSVTVIAVVVIFFAILWFLDLALYPCTYLRNDVHRITTEQKDVLIMGTSNGKMGIDTDYLLADTGLTGHNLAAGSEYPVDSYYLARLVIETQKPKMIIYEIDPGYFTTAKEKGNNYLLFWHEFPLSLSKVEYSASILDDSDFRALLFPFYEYPLRTVMPRMKDTLGKKIGQDYSVASLKSSIQEYHENGFIEKYPVSEDHFPAFEAEPFRTEDIQPENLDSLIKLITLCKKEQVEFIAVSMPLPDKNLEDNRESLEAAWDYFSDLFAAQEVRYYNFNREQYRSYSHLAAHYVDYEGHLNGDSAREFSAIFGGMLAHRTDVK